METSGLINVATSFGHQQQAVQHGWVSAAAAGDTPLVAARPHSAIRLLSILFLGGASTSITFKSGTTAISPAFVAGDNGGALANHNPHGWLLDTKAGEALVATVGAGEAIGMIYTWVEVPIGR